MWLGEGRGKEGGFGWGSKGMRSREEEGVGREEEWVRMRVREGGALGGEVRVGMRSEVGNKGRVG